MCSADVLPSLNWRHWEKAYLLWVELVYTLKVLAQRTTPIPLQINHMLQRTLHASWPTCTSIHVHVLAWDSKANQPSSCLVHSRKRKLRKRDRGGQRGDRPMGSPHPKVKVQVLVPSHRPRWTSCGDKKPSNWPNDENSSKWWARTLAVVRALAPPPSPRCSVKNCPLQLHCSPLMMGMHGMEIMAHQCLSSPLLPWVNSTTSIHVHFTCFLSVPHSYTCSHAHTIPMTTSLSWVGTVSSTLWRAR